MLTSVTVNFKRKNNVGNSPLQQEIITLMFMGSHSYALSQTLDHIPGNGVKL